MNHVPENLPSWSTMFPRAVIRDELIMERWSLGDMHTGFIMRKATWDVPGPLVKNSLSLRLPWEMPYPAIPFVCGSFSAMLPFLLSLSPGLCKDIPRAPFLTHQNSIKFILQNIFCNQEVISNWLSVQARAAMVEYQEDPSIIGRPACSWPDPTSSFTLESRFRPDKRFRAAAPCGDPSQDTIYYPPLPPPPPSLASAQISSDHLGMLANNHKQTQLGLNSEL